MNGVSKINNHDMVCVWVLAQQTVMESGDKVYQVVTKFTVSLLVLFTSYPTLAAFPQEKYEVNQHRR